MKHGDIWHWRWTKVYTIHCPFDVKCYLLNNIHIRSFEQKSKYKASTTLGTKGLSTLALALRASDANALVGEWSVLGNTIHV